MSLDSDRSELGARQASDISSDPQEKDPPAFVGRREGLLGNPTPTASDDSLSFPTEEPTGVETFVNHDMVRFLEALHNAQVRPTNDSVVEHE